MSKTLFLVRGLPGSGKSTLARLIVDGDRVFEADDFFVDREGKYKFIPEQVPEAHLRCKLATLKAVIRSDRDVAVANTFSQKWEMMPYIELAALYGWSVEIAEPDTKWARSPLGCHSHCVHDVPLRVIEGMLKRWEKLDDNTVRSLMEASNAIEVKA